MEKHYFNAKINKIGTKLIFVHELTYTLYIYIYLYKYNEGKRLFFRTRFVN